MPKANLATMSVSSLMKLRNDVEIALSHRADQLRNELSKLDGHKLDGHNKDSYRSPLKGRKVPIKYRDRSGNTWAGRGAQPRWLTAKLKAGAKLKDFAVKR